MPRQHLTLLVPGCQITDAEAALAGPPLDGAADQPLGGPFETRFRDGHVLIVEVVNSNPPQIVAELVNQLGETVHSEVLGGKIDQDYSLMDGETTYEVTILRAADTILTHPAVRAYEAANGAWCPACRSTDIHGSPPQVDGPTISVRVECCSCGARWKDLYNFHGISELAEDWEPPTQNVRQQTT